MFQSLLPIKTSGAEDKLNMPKHVVIIARYFRT